jgi:hypothetical protein
MSRMHNQLDWCSAAEGQRWAKIMKKIEELRAAVTAEVVAETREALKDQKVPTSTKVWRLNKPATATMRCYRCGNEWDVMFDLAAAGERMCPACRSDSVWVVLVCWILPLI